MQWTEEYIERLRTQTLYFIDFETDIVIKECSKRWLLHKPEFAGDKNIMGK